MTPHRIPRRSRIHRGYPAIRPARQFHQQRQLSAGPQLLSAIVPTAESETGVPLASPRAIRIGAVASAT